MAHPEAPMNWELVALLVLGTIASLIPLAVAWYRERKAKKQPSRLPQRGTNDLETQQDAAVREAMALLAANARRRLSREP
jgi:hypothetical protein